MNCPNVVAKSKGKKGADQVCGAGLQTKRTLADGTKVRRERVCPKCHARFWTVEQLQSSVTEAEFRHSEDLRIHKHTIEDLRSQIKEHTALFLGFRCMMDKAAGMIKP